MHPLRALAAASVVALVACSGRAGDVDTQRHASPVIDSIVPGSGPMGTATPIRATLFGTGFDDTDNVVVFGGIEVPGRPSTDGGTRILFSIPKVRPIGTEAPPPVLQPGEYDVTVRAAGGESAPVRFRLDPR